RGDARAARRLVSDRYVPEWTLGSELLRKQAAAEPQSSVTRSASMRRRTTGDSRTPIRGKGWKRSSTIATDKYDTISKAILNSLTTTPITFSELVKLVRAHLQRFDNSVPWFTMSCLRELETQGRVTKHRKPVLYSRASRSS